ncbi:MAG: hypothetical protein AAF288_13870 [Planctomycetota bacterium]
MRVVRLFDAHGEASEFKLSEDFSSARRTPRKIALASLAGAGENVPASLSRIELVFNSAPTKVELDNLRLTGTDGSTIAITDKPLDQRRAEAAKSRRARMDAAFAEEVRRPRHASLMNVYFARLWPAESDAQLEAVNDDLHRLLTSEGSDEWNQRGLIFQGARRVLRQSPAWFPNETHQLEGMVVGMAKARHIEEDRGWVFVQNGGTMLAIRVIDGVQKPISPGGNTANKGTVDFPLQSEHVDLVETPYTWNQTKDKLKFDDAWSPVIFEAGRLDDFGSLHAFKQYIFSNRVTLLKTVVPGFYRLRYEFGPNNETRIDFNAANLQIPRINGEPIDYDPPYLFKSPFLHCEHQTGVIRFGLPTAMEASVFVPANERDE